MLLPISAICPTVKDPATALLSVTFSQKWAYLGFLEFRAWHVQGAQAGNAGCHELPLQATNTGDRKQLLQQHNKQCLKGWLKWNHGC